MNSKRKIVKLIFAVLLSCNVPSYLMHHMEVILFLSLLQSTNKVSGKVVDSKERPIVGVSVIVQGTNIGAMTNADGMYSIQTEKADTACFRLHWLQF